MKLNDDNVTGKSVWTAIGMNLVLMGAGFFYMGRKVVGVFLMVVTLVSYYIWGPIIFLMVLCSSIPASIDLGIYAKRMKIQSFRDCPKCGNQVKKTASFCAACQTDIGAA